jgi:hypothetical protein
MRLHPWRNQSLTSHQAPRPAARRPGRRLSLEALEDRIVLSSFTAATVADLVADIHAANQAGGANTITLVPGSSFQLTAVDNTTDGATGLPVIAANDHLNIVGNGDVLARSTAAGTPAFRLFDVAAGASLTLQNLTLQGGLAFGAGVSAEGGALYSLGTLDLNGVSVHNNTAQGSTGQSAAGGAIYSGGTLTLEGGSMLQDNLALGGQGAPSHFQGGSGGDGLGGALYLAGGTATVTGATLSANTAQGGQGGRGFASSIKKAGNGGSGGNGLGGGLYVVAGTVTLSTCLLSSNTAQGGQGGTGGRDFGNGGNGGNGFGGGLYASGAAVTLITDTVTGNSALRGSAGHSGGLGSNGHPGLGEGGGLFIDPTALVCLDTFTHANVKNNTASTKGPNIHGPWKPC